jgi:hypothetical protein
METLLKTAVVVEALQLLEKKPRQLVVEMVATEPLIRLLAYR